jgi:hypothetical protein
VLDVRVHAAESLFKVGEVGDGKLLRLALAECDPILRMMAAGALAKRGDAAALALVRKGRSCARAWLIP